MFTVICLLKNKTKLFVYFKNKTKIVVYLDHRPFRRHIVSQVERYNRLLPNLRYIRRPIRRSKEKYL
jgi:23S rRNA G2069 N7-methylase RlmK/C1962 C5-methylase RlmI